MHLYPGAHLDFLVVKQKNIKLFQTNVNEKVVK